MMGKSYCGSQSSTSQDLLQLEKPNMNSPLESTLRILKNNGKPTSKFGTKYPNYGSSVPVGDSEVLKRVKEFLPTMGEANHKLKSIQDEGQMDLNIEALSEGAPHIEMDLILGVADLKNEQAVLAAELAATGHNSLDARPSHSLDEDSSDSDEKICNSSGRDDKSLKHNAQKRRKDKNGKSCTTSKCAKIEMLQ